MNEGTYPHFGSCAAKVPSIGILEVLGAVEGDSQSRKPHLGKSKQTTTPRKTPRVL